MSLIFACITPHPPVLLPEVGRHDAEVVRKTAEGMRRVAQDLAAVQPEVAILVSPHGESYAEAMAVSVADRSAGDFLSWGASGLSFQYQNDVDLANAIREEATRESIPCRKHAGSPYALDHGSLVPLYFLRQAMEGVGVLPVTFSALPLRAHFGFGQAIQRAAEKSGRRVAFIASGDLSHRLLPGAPAGFDTMGKVFDEKIVELLQRRDVDGILSLDRALIVRAGQCGLNSIVTLLGALSGLRWTPEIISYEGPFGVGYLVVSFQVATTVDEVAHTVDTSVEEAIDRPDQKNDTPAMTSTGAGLDFLLNLARDTVEQYVRYRTTPLLMELSPELREQAGVFVSIHKGRDLRGCIGTIEPAQPNVAQETVVNAVSSATSDPRFSPIEPDELPLLNYSVDVLGKPERIDGIEALDPRQYGVVVESSWRRGLLLPDLEGVDTARQQVEIARRKAEILPGDPVTLYRFEVKRFSEH